MAHLGSTIATTRGSSINSPPRLRPSAQVNRAALRSLDDARPAAEAELDLAAGLALEALAGGRAGLDAGGSSGGRRHVVVPAALHRIAAIGAGHVEEILAARRAGVADVDPPEV